MALSNNYNVKVGDKIPDALIGKYSNIVSKAIEDPNKLTNNGGKDIEQQDYFHAMGIAEQTSSIIDTNREILELFPDIKIATDVRVSAIIDPNSQEDEEFRIRMKKSSLPVATIGKIIPTVKKNIEDLDLKQIIEEALVDKGAWIEAIIPEPLLDKIIMDNIEESRDNNGKKGREKHGTQSTIDTSKVDKIDMDKARKNFSLGILSRTSAADNSGLLSDSNLASLNIKSDLLKNESKKKIVEDIFKINDTIITDNIMEIKTVQSALPSANSLVKEKLSIFKKNKSKITNEDINSLFSKTKKKKEDFIAMPAVKASSNKGQSLHIKLPVSSCIPIYPSGEPHNHIGYFVLINPRTGVPIRDEEFSDRRNYMLQNMRSNVSQSSNHISAVMKELQGYSTNQDLTIQDIDKTYSRLLDLKIKSVLKDSVFDDIVEIDIETNDAYRVMLSRVLESKDTKMIFLPKELVSYIAFEYRTNGTGRSLMEKISFFASIRAIVLFTNLMAKMSNSMTNTVVNAEIDEDDRNPKGTRNSIISNFMNSKGQRVPLFVYNPRELSSWANTFGIQFNIKHPTFGNTEVSVEEKSGARSEVDTELEELVFQYILYAIGVNKETVDSVKNNDYATAVTARSKFFAKRIANDQKKLNPQLSELIKRRISYNILAYEQIKEIVIADYSEIIKSYLPERLGDDEAKEEIKKASSNEKQKEALIDVIIELIIDDIESYMPKPEVTEDVNEKTIFDGFKESVDSILESIISDDVIIESAGGEITTVTKENLTKIIKSTAMMRFLKENNYMSSITDMFSVDSDGKTLVNPIEEYASFVEAINAAAFEAKEKLEKNNIKLNKKLSDLEEKLGSEEDNGETDSTGDESDSASEDTGTEEVPEGTEDTGTEDTGAEDNTEADNAAEDDATPKEEKEEKEEEAPAEEEKEE